MGTIIAAIAAISPEALAVFARILANMTYAAMFSDGARRVTYGAYRRIEDSGADVAAVLNVLDKYTKILRDGGAFGLGYNMHQTVKELRTILNIPAPTPEAPTPEAQAE